MVRNLFELHYLINGPSRLLFHNHKVVCQTPIESMVHFLGVYQAKAKTLLDSSGRPSDLSNGKGFVFLDADGPWDIWCMVKRVLSLYQKNATFAGLYNSTTVSTVSVQFYERYPTAHSCPNSRENRLGHGFILLYLYICIFSIFISPPPCVFQGQKYHPVCSIHHQLCMYCPLTSLGKYDSNWCMQANLCTRQVWLHLLTLYGQR